MNKRIKLADQEIKYDLKKSKRAKKLRVAICADTGVVVTKPWFLPQFYVERFLHAKASWILQKIDKFNNKQNKIHIPRRHRRAYLKYKEQVREFVHQTLQKYNESYNFSYKQVRIKNHKSRWGSCSEDNNLNFSYRIIYLPVHMAEYIVVHELCHLGQLNHSKQYWELVAKSFPDYKEIEKELKTI